jgi:antitoxin component YwqK of YwqJK toxin-antitoxin module
MSKAFPVLIFVALSAVALAQQTRIITKQTNGYNEEYTVLKSDKSIRHGSYVKYRKPFNTYVILESGNYSNGQKDGLWQTFTDGSPSGVARNSIREKGIYVNGKKNGTWTYYYLDTVENVTKAQKYKSRGKVDSISIDIDQRGSRVRLAGMFLNDKRVGEWLAFNPHGEVVQINNFSKGKLLFDVNLEDTAAFNTNRNALFLGGDDQLVESFFQNSLSVSLTEGAMTSKIDSVVAVAQFTIGATAKLEDIVVTSAPRSKVVEDGLYKLVQLTEYNWLPGLKDSQKVNSIRKMRVRITRKRLGQTISEDVRFDIPAK